MSIIHKINPYDQLLSSFNNSSAGLFTPDDLPTDPILHIPAQGKPEIRILEGEKSSDSRTEECRESIDPGKTQVFEASDVGTRDHGKFHRVPKNLIKELGVEAAAVLYGFSLILKTHKSNKNNGHYWYYDTLDELIVKRWPYLKRTSLFAIVNKLRDKEYLLISKENKKGYDRTMRYSMYNSKIDQVLEDKHFWFDTNIAKKTGVLGALVFHNIQYRISDGSPNETESQETIECHPKISNLAEIFDVSESTVKRQLKTLIQEGLLAKGRKNGFYSRPVKLTVFKNGANPNDNIPKWSELSYKPNGSNLNEIESNPNETRSILNENGSNPNDNTIYETNGNHIGIQIRSAPQLFLNKEENEEFLILSASHSGFEKVIHSDLSLRQGISVPLDIGTIIDYPFNSDSNHLAIQSETRPEIHKSSPQIDHSGSEETRPEASIMNQQINDHIIPQYTDESRSFDSRKIHRRSSDNGLDKSKNIKIAKSIISFGRKIDIPQKTNSKFGKLALENSRIENIFYDLSSEQRVFIQDSLLRLCVRFIESLPVEMRITLLNQDSPDKVLDLIFEEAFSFIEDKHEEFRINGESVLPQEKTFPAFPFLEITVRGILLFKKTDANPFLADEFTIYSIFEALSFGLLDKTIISPEIKALFFNFMILRARATKMDNKASNGKSLNITKHHGSKITDFSGYSSEAEFLSLVHFFREKESTCSEEVFFKYSKCIEYKIAIGKSKNEYEKHWHAINFSDISQFLKFYPKISEAIEDSCCDFKIPWKPVPEYNSYFSDEYLHESTTFNAVDNQRDLEDLERLVRLRQYFKKVKKDIRGSDYYRSAPLQELDFKEALLLCKEYELAPEDIVDLAVELLGKADARFSTIHLRGPLVKKALKAEIVNNPRYTGLVTNENLEMEDVWRAQCSLLEVYIKNGESAEDVLSSSSLKFYSWFRILVTEVPIPSIIERYQRTAACELDYKIKRFIRRSGLDLSRICK